MGVKELILCLTVVLGHNGVVHDQSSGCSGSIFAGSNSSEGMFVLDWLAQRLFLLDDQGEQKHTWKLPDSYFYAIAEHDQGAFVSIGNATAVFTPTTNNDNNDFGIVIWVATGESVHKIRKHNNTYYGLNILSGHICQFDENLTCNNIISSTPSSYLPDKDYVKAWSFAINGSKIYVIGFTGIKYTTDFGSTWNDVHFDLYMNLDFEFYELDSSSRIKGSKHAYGDLFYHETTDRLLITTGDVCSGCNNAQKENNAGKVLTVLPERRVLAVGLRHPYMSALIGDILLIGDVGDVSYEELNVMNVMETEIVNFMWPIYEGQESNYRHFPIYGGTPRTPKSVFKHCPSTIRAYGAYASFASGAVIILIAIITHYGKYIEHLNQILFQLVVVIAIVAPVWFGSEYGFDYYEGIVYYVEDGKLATYNPSASEYSLYALLTISGCIIIFPILAHSIALVTAFSVLVVKKRDYPFYVEWAFVVPFFVVVVMSLVFEIYKRRKQQYTKIIYTLVETNFFIE